MHRQREDFAFLTEFVKAQAGPGSRTTEEALRYLFGAEREYIEAYYHAIDGKYGSFDHFIADGLKLSSEDIQGLRRLYLTPEAV